MKQIVFSENISINIDKIDEQHKHLLSMINSFLNEIHHNTNPSIQDLERTLDCIIGYALFHFSCEEKLMEERNCPLTNFAKYQHQQFTLKLNKLKYELKALGLTSGILQEMENLLTDWLESHLTHLDTKLRYCTCQGNREH